MKDIFGELAREESCSAHFWCIRQNVIILGKGMAYTQRAQILSFPRDLRDTSSVPEVQSSQPEVMKQLPRMTSMVALGQCGFQHI